MTRQTCRLELTQTNRAVEMATTIIIATTEMTHWGQTISKVTPTLLTHHRVAAAATTSDAEQEISPKIQ